MNILVMGDAMTDEYVYTRLRGQSPEDPHANVYKPYKVETKLGGALNVAANIASLLPDHSVDFCGIVSRSQKARANKLNINTPETLCHNISENKCIKKQRIICDNKQICRVDYNDILPQHKCLYHAINKFPDLSLYDCIVISDYDKGTIFYDLPKELKDYEKLVVVDTKKTWFTGWSKLKNCIVKINAKEYTYASEEIHALNRIITAGDEGSYYYKKNQKAWSLKCLPVISTPNFDANVIGAGDAYLAGMVAQYFDSCCEIHVSLMMAMGTRAAFQSINHFGTQNTLKNLDEGIYVLNQEKASLEITA